jgi:hypothetical protein
MEDTFLSSPLSPNYYDVIRCKKVAVEGEGEEEEDEDEDQDQ